MLDEFNNRLPIAEVVWEDAWIDPKDISMEDAVKLMPIIRSTVGYVVSKENANCLVLATDLYQKDQSLVNTPMVIPWDAIIAWCEFEVH